MLSIRYAYDMNLRDLEYLVAVADTKNFRKAAEKCFVSQPALSMQLKKLEEYLGVSLFERDNKHVYVTEVGKQIVSYAKNILNIANEIKITAKSFQDPFSGEIKIGIIPTISPYLTPKLMPKLQKKYPNLTILILEEKTHILTEKLKNGEVDTIITALPINEELIESEKIIQDEFLVAVSKSNPLAKRKTINLENLYSETLLLLDDGHCLRNQALEVCSLISNNEKLNFKATSLETLRQMVICNTGITLIPKIACNKNDGLAYLKLKNPKPYRNIGISWRKTSFNKDCLNAVAKVALECLKVKDSYL